MKTKKLTWAKVCLTTAYGLTALLMVAYVLSAIGLKLIERSDHQLIVVTSGSMEPQFSPGDTLLVKRGNEHLKKGDILTYRTETGLTTHRAIAFPEVQGKPHVQTKGDANEAPDPNFTPREAVLGTVEGHYPNTGKLLLFVGSPQGKLAFLAPLLLLIAVHEVYKFFSYREEPDAAPAPVGKRRKT